MIAYYVIPGLKNGEKSHQLIIMEICKRLKVDPSDIVRKTRKKEICEARQIAFYIFSIYTRLSLKQIANIFGGFDHSTVIHARERIRSLCSIYPDLDATIKEIRTELGLVKK